MPAIKKLYKSKHTMRTILSLFSICILSFMLQSCAKKEAKETEQIPVVTVKASPVTFGKIDNKLTFNGKTIYLRKNLVVSPLSGYIRKMYIKFGDSVKKGELLFEIQDFWIFNFDIIIAKLVPVFTPPVLDSNS